MHSKSGNAPGFLANLGVVRTLADMRGALVLCLLLTATSAACRPEDNRVHGNNAELFLGTLDPSARQCAANALPSERLESALTSLCKLPHHGALSLLDLEQL